MSAVILPALLLLQLHPVPGLPARLHAITRTPGFVALWDFVKMDPQGNFTAHQPPNSPYDFHLEPINYIYDYWHQGRPATNLDFPLLNRGPFGQAIQIRNEPDPDFRPLLQIPRARLHNTPLDVKGPGQSVTMIVWLIRESGNHALAGIWHEGTDLGNTAARVERGMRQYALFAGLAANPGAAAAHVSENGRASFGDRYARNLAVTPEVMRAVPANAPLQNLDQSWQVAAFTYDNRRHEVTAYLNGKATEYWIEDPAHHPFYQWAARAWQRAQLDPPSGHAYNPPETKPRKRNIESETQTTRQVLQTYRYTKVRVTYHREGNGAWKPATRELVALKANPYWFPHDLYAPISQQEGGPFTIGRVIHTGRSVGFTGYIGGVAIFNRPLTPRQIRRLASPSSPLQSEPRQ